MLRRILPAAVLGAAAWILSGCAPAVLSKSDGGIIFDNPSDFLFTVDVVAKYHRRQALDLADEHCQKVGRMVRLTRRTGNALYYDCVK